MKRLVESQILSWIGSKRRKPLIIRGARQVGKTWLVEEFAARQFPAFVKVDFEERGDLHFLFEGNLEPRFVLESLETAVGRIIPGKTLLFFDEIQACPRAITALRYFYEKMPELHVIAAGSLFEFAVGDVSIPVGRVQYLHVQPMTFYEYLLAVGKQSMAEQSLKFPQDTPEPVQQMILDELKKFFFVGGMPECVQVYRDSGSMVEAFAVQSEILESFRDDFSKYKPHVDTECLDSVFLEAALAVGEQIKYTRLDNAHTGPTNRKAFNLLVKARVLNRIPASTPAGIPLKTTVNHKKFKAAMLDIGLLQRLCHVPVHEEIVRNDLLAMYRGKLAEQFVAQELIAWHGRELYFWARNARNSNAEVDYLTVKDGEVYPIEVKASASGSLKSLHMLLQQYVNCPQGLVLNSGMYKELPEQKLRFIPLYAVPSICDREAGGL